MCACSCHLAAGLGHGSLLSRILRPCNPPALTTSVQGQDQASLFETSNVPLIKKGIIYEGVCGAGQHVREWARGHAGTAPPRFEGVVGYEFRSGSGQ